MDTLISIPVESSYKKFGLLKPEHHFDPQMFYYFLLCVTQWFLIIAFLKHLLCIGFLASLYSSVFCLSTVGYLFTIPDLQIPFTITALRSGRRASIFSEYLIHLQWLTSLLRNFDNLFLCILFQRGGLTSVF